MKQHTFKRTINGMTSRRATQFALQRGKYTGQIVFWFTRFDSASALSRRSL